MKNVSEALIGYMTTQPNFICCDLFEFHFTNGTVYKIADFDIDVSDYRHDLFIVKRDQTKTTGQPSVDALNVTVYVDNNDGINILKQCHDGIFDNAVIKLRRAYFDDNRSLVGIVDLFSGKAEIASVGGLGVKFNVKAQTSGLASLYPVRIFASGKAYRDGTEGAIATSSTDTTTVAIPLKPSANVLVSL